MSMMDDLAQQLRDERSLRLAAERRAAELAANVGTWRSRAEERAERIEVSRRGYVFGNAERDDGDFGKLARG